MNNTQVQKKFEEFNETYGLGTLDLSKYTLGRTRFQLENFVVKEHDCPERKFLQVIVELKALRDGAIVDMFEQQKIKIEINRLLATGDEIDAIEAAKKQYTLGMMQESMKYREREIQVLVDLLKQFPKMYTYEEIEAGEKTYWEKRLTRQIAEDMVTAQTGINQGNIRSAIQAGTSVEKYFLAFQEHFLTQMKHPELSVPTQNMNVLESK
jgi:hypothetical protein